MLPDMIPAEAPPLLAPYVKLIPSFELHLMPEHPWSGGGKPSICPTLTIACVLSVTSYTWITP
ncbi:hypothetical protein QUB06_31525 [Microcoleus sp. D2_18a_D3]